MQEIDVKRGVVHIHNWTVSVWSTNALFLLRTTSWLLKCLRCCLESNVPWTVLSVIELMCHSLGSLPQSFRVLPAMGLAGCAGSLHTATLLMWDVKCCMLREEYATTANDSLKSSQEYFYIRSEGDFFQRRVELVWSRNSTRWPVILFVRYIILGYERAGL